VNDNPVQDLLERLPSLMAAHPGIEAEVEDDDGEIFIASVAADQPGAGHGSRWLEALTALADEMGATLSADPSDGREGWYARHGFEAARWGRMVREPSPAPGMTPGR